PARAPQMPPPLPRAGPGGLLPPPPLAAFRAPDRDHQPLEGDHQSLDGGHQSLDGDHQFPDRDRQAELAGGPALHTATTEAARRLHSRRVAWSRGAAPTGLGVFRPNDEGARERWG